MANSRSTSKRGARPPSQPSRSSKRLKNAATPAVAMDLPSSPPPSPPSLPLSSSSPPSPSPPPPSPSPSQSSTATDEIFVAVPHPKPLPKRRPPKTNPNPNPKPSSSNSSVSDAEPSRSSTAAKNNNSDKKKLGTPPIESDQVDATFFDPFTINKAKATWPKRYHLSSKVEARKGLPTHCEIDGDWVLQAKSHFGKVVLDGCSYSLNDDVFVFAGEKSPNYIAKIVELFETVDGQQYYTARWFFRAEDTVIGENNSHLIDSRRVFFSDLTDENPIDSIVSRINILRVEQGDPTRIPPCDFYYNLAFTSRFLTFSNLPPDDSQNDFTMQQSEEETSLTGAKPEMSLLDLYSGCGAMSTGLCLGASMANVKLVTRWAVDQNPDACESLKFNHPETEVRNEDAENFLCLLKEWKNLCSKFELINSETTICESDDDGKEDDDDSSALAPGEFEVQKILSICYGDPNKKKKIGIHFKVRWKGYGPEDDTWEPLIGLSNCEDSIKTFVKKGFRSKLLPLPGEVDFICGGPPCQGISGFNRFRMKDDPLKDPKNHQLVVYMDIVEFLKPKHVLMENVVDILKFSRGFLGRHAVGRLISMNYQTRMGMLSAGSYGLPQFRMRVFLWGAHHSMKLPQFPSPTHEVDGRGVTPNEFEDIVVRLENKELHNLEKALSLADAISDLPPVTNNADDSDMSYGMAVPTCFQSHIRSRKKGVDGLLFDHCPLDLNRDDLQRVQKIPKRKGANFRDLPGVIVNANNRVELDPSIDRAYLSSGKPLVPDYALKFVDGRSTKPFARLWWDEIVSTVVTRAEPHNQALLHPTQDRVLSIRENARLQGFPDFYKLFGTLKQRYMQVGNAVAVPVGCALGYTFGLATRRVHQDCPLLKLPFKYPECLSVVFDDEDLQLYKA